MQNRCRTVKPEIAKDCICQMKDTYHSINGESVALWKKKGNQLNMQISMPVNASVSIYVMATSQNKVFENGKLLKKYGSGEH